MALRYESFGIRHFEFTAHMWPELDEIAPRDLRRLFGQLTLGRDDEFTSCDLRTANMGARFEGEHWIYDIAPGSILLRCRGYAPDLPATVRALLEQTRTFFASTVHVAFFVNEIRVWAIVPDDKDRHVGDLVLRRLLRNLKRDELGPNLSGITGGGLQLVGDAEEFHWHARIEPPHGSYDVLGIGVELMFPLAPEPPNEDDDLDTIDNQVGLAHSFITKEVVAFAGQLFH
jgi:hypothetical protein